MPCTLLLTRLIPVADPASVRLRLCLLFVLTTCCQPSACPRLRLLDPPCGLYVSSRYRPLLARPLPPSCVCVPSSRVCGLPCLPDHPAIGLVPPATFGFSVRRPGTGSSKSSPPSGALENTCQCLDSASRGPLVTVRASQMSEPAGYQLDNLCQQVAALTQVVKTLQGCFTQLELRTGASATPVILATAATPPAVEVSTAPSTMVVLPPEPRVPAPERFTGDRSKFRAFHNACQLYFGLQPRTFSLESTKVGFTISLLQGEPQSWAHLLLEQDSPKLASLSAFFEAMALLYDDPQRTVTAETALHSLRQGRRPVEDYICDFRRVSADTNWNDAALRFQFRLGLSESLKDELARVGVPDTLEGLATQATQIDRRLRERRFERSLGPARPMWMTSSITPTPYRPYMREVATAHDSEPIQLGLTRFSLSPDERLRRQQKNLCMYCGEAGHYVRNCPTKQRKLRVVSTTPPSPVGTTSPHLMVSVCLQLPEGRIQVSAIIDSGACSCFMDSGFSATHNIPLQPRGQSLAVHLADGSHLRSGPVTQETLPLPATILSTHHELLKFDVITSPLFPVILGIPWLLAHNPSIDWATGQVRFNSLYCQEHCLPGPVVSSVPLLGITPEDEVTSVVPPAYHDFLDVFNKKGAEVLPPHRPYDCPIELLPGTEVPFGPIFSLSEPELEALREYVDENLKRGFIRPSTSPAGAGIFFVEKKDHTLRPCVDYRELNRITVKNRYPLPLVPELFQRLRASKVFTKLDLRGAYNLVRIREGDEWKTAFRTRFGHFEYLVMPFGLCNAPATFQHFINDIFRDYLDLFVIAYLDDILIFSASLELHREHVRKVLTRLRCHSLFAKPEKCEFEVQRIQFLGLIISISGVEMDPQKVSAILEWPAPKDKKGVQRFIGFANFYRKFIRNFSTIVAPITKLTKQGQAFLWSPEAQSAFEKLKELFTSAPVLRHPDPALPYILEVDASEVATGAILSQRQGPSATMHPVAFFSRKLSPAERNYDVGDRELLAIKSAFEEWRYLLEGAAHPVLIYTDHKNLEYLRTAKRLRPRQARWALFFTRFAFHITYRPGSKNGKADALSRMHGGVREETTPDTILSEGNFLLLYDDLLGQLRQASVQDPEPRSRSLAQKDGLYWKGDLIYVPKNLRPLILERCHDHPLAGHFGTHKTTELVQRYFWWPDLGGDCSRYVTACTTCARSKGSRTKAWGLLRPLPVPERPWQMIAMDFIVELPPSDGHTAIFVIVDRLTKMAHFIPLTGTPSASETAQVFIREVVRLHGVPTTITSDRGVQFTSRFWKSLCASLQIDLAMSSAYHPQTNGQTERTNQTLEQYLRCFSSSVQNDWSALLPLAEFAYNNSSHSAIQQSPFFANYGFHPQFLPLGSHNSTVPAVQDMLQFLTTNNRLLQDTMTRAQAASKAFFDKKRKGDLVLRPGDLVWLSTANLKLTCPSKKLGPRFVGPFPVSRRINPVCYKLVLPDNLKIHPVFHVSLLKPVVHDPFPGRKKMPPAPVLVDDAEEYEVEAILDCRRCRGQVQYLVKWKGYNVEDNSWEPSSNLHAPVLLRAFQRAHPRKLARLGIRRMPVGRGHCQGTIRRPCHRVVRRPVIGRRSLIRRHQPIIGRRSLTAPS